ncbi:MAG: radical SAM protein [Candidatus Heimdallarchaeota archaeon]
MKCSLCGKDQALIAKILGVCPSCVREHPAEALEISKEAHISIRRQYNLPGLVPDGPKGVTCTVCANRCRIPPGELGFCGLRTNENGKLVHLAGTDVALVHTYIDPHPTNCCAWWCPAATGLGYPQYVNTPDCEYGFVNLATFFYSCSFSCLYCQNPSHKDISSGRKTRVEEFVNKALSDPRISCVCYFGGDGGGPHAPFSIRVSKELREQTDRIMRICWETNGIWRKDLMLNAAEIAYESGGNVKFDLKAPVSSKSPLNEILSGTKNNQAYHNFEMVYNRIGAESDSKIPVQMATILLVPGYVDVPEVESIARFVGSLDPEIPLSLLIFHPQWNMRDLPITPRKQALECREAASRFCNNVHVGNLNLLLD